MSDADRINLAYVQETTYATTPASPAFTLLRITSESLSQETTTVRSAEIRSDRQTADVVRTNINVSGDINFELSYGTYDDLLVSALLAADWSSEESVSAKSDYSVDVGADVRITDNTGGTDFVDFEAGQWIEVRGFSNEANNGFFKIASVEPLGEYIVIANGSTMVDSGGPDGTVTITMGPQIVNGTTLDSYQFEKEFSDLSNTFALFSGCCINTMSLNIAADQLITGTLGIVGKQEVTASSTADSDSTYTAAPTNEVMAAVEDIEAIVDNNTNISCTTFTFSLNNNLRSRNIIGTLGAISMGTGNVLVNGTVQMYFETSTIMDKYLDWTSSSLAVIAEDSDGNTYIFEFPNIKYSSGTRVAGGQNQDILADMAFEAYRDPDEDFTIRIVKFDA